MKRLQSAALFIPQKRCYCCQADSFRGDKTYTLFQHLVCAKFNVLIGNEDACITVGIGAADQWMSDNGPVGSGVAARNSAWQSISGTSTLLDDYNNGLLCAPHRD